MEPYEGHAVCPRCGRTDDVVLGQLFVVTGASGSGKTSVFGPLARRLRGRCVIFDSDLLMDAAGALSGSRPIDWAAFHSAWLAVAHGVAQSGTPAVLLGPFIPAHLQELAARRWFADIHFIALDCPDELRRARMSARPRWRNHDIDEQVEFGRWLRRNIAERVDTSRGTPDDAAAVVASCIVSRTTSHNPSAERPAGSGPGQPRHDHRS